MVEYIYIITIIPDFNNYCPDNCDCDACLSGNETD
jgi:hypothetical protein